MDLDRIKDLAAALCNPKDLDGIASKHKSCKGIVYKARAVSKYSEASIHIPEDILRELFEGYTVEDRFQGGYIGECRWELSTMIGKVKVYAISEEQ